MSHCAAVVGGSLCGLAAANLLTRLGFAVDVFEKFPGPMHQRGASLNYCDVELWESIRGVPMMRRGCRAHRSQGGFYYGDLWQFLYEGLPPDCVKFNHTVESWGDDNRNPIIFGKAYDLVIVADGGWSSLRKYIDNTKQPEYAGYVIYRAKLDKQKFFPDFAGEGKYNNGRYFAIALNIPFNEGSDFIMGAVMAGVPESEIVRPAAGQPMSHVGLSASLSEHNSNELPHWFLPFVRRTFPHHGNGELLQWIELCASGKGKITPLPLFEFMADNVASGHIILMGDAAHMASPRTEVGAHTAVLDAVGLYEALLANPGNIDAAIKAYEPGGMQRARELFISSKELSQFSTYLASADARFDVGKDCSDASEVAVASSQSHNDAGNP